MPLTTFATNYLRRKHLPQFLDAGRQIGASSRRPVETLAHFLAGLEERHRFLVDGHVRAGSRVAAGAGSAVLDRKSAEATQFNTIAPGQGRYDLTQNRVDDILYVTLIKVGILSRNALDEF
jgi:hypothetical protein